jgi:hypothetical protein
MHKTTGADFIFNSLVYSTYRIHYDALNERKQMLDMQNTLTLRPYEHSFKSMPFFKATSVACMPTPPVAPKIATVFIISDYVTNHTQTHPQNRQVTPRLY